MNSLSFLLATRPAWIEVTEQETNQIEFCATPVRPSGLPGRVYSLKLQLCSGDRIKVRENAANSLMPTFCMERHINPDGSFCVFLNSSEPISNEVQAGEWWSGLNRYLNCQDYAHDKLKWPINSGLCHGEAAHSQIEIEKIAEPLGWLIEVRRGIFRNEGWLAHNLPRLTKDSEKPVTKRSNCPRGCVWKQGVLRNRTCSTDNSDQRRLNSPKKIVRADCSQREQLEAIIVLEHERRRLEDEFTKEMKKRKLKCCGTMKNCLLAE